MITAKCKLSTLIGVATENASMVESFLFDIIKCDLDSNHSQTYELDISYLRTQPYANSKKRYNKILHKTEISTCK